MYRNSQIDLILMLQLFWPLCSPIWPPVPTKLLVMGSWGQKQQNTGNILVPKSIAFIFQGKPQPQMSGTRTLCHRSFLQDFLQGSTFEPRSCNFSYMGVSQNRGPKIRSQDIMVLIMAAPQKGLLIFGYSHIGGPPTQGLIW